MFAIFEDGGRQYRVSQGDLVSLDFRKDAENGQTITLERVLLANGGGGSVFGKPVIEGASIAAQVVVPEEKGPKLEIQKLRRRHASRRHTGHRQKYTQVKITGITVPNLEVVSGN